MARYRFLILAGVVAAVVAIPLLVNQASRFGLNPIRGIAESQSRAEFTKRQTSLRRAFTSPEYRQAWGKELRLGDPFARLIIPKLGVDLIVAEGVSLDALKNGAGHYPDSGLPGERGNVAVAGRRTSFGEPFRHLEKLTEGDLLFLMTPDGRFTYKLSPPFDGHTNPWVTEPLDWGVVGPVDAAVATLTTVNPSDTAKNRLIARFELVKREPV